MTSARCPSCRRPMPLERTVLVIARDDDGTLYALVCARCALPRPTVR